MRLGLGEPFLRRCGLLEDAFNAFGRKIELNESEAAVKGFRVVRDQPVAKNESS
jgi:hypothetical protein